MMKNKQTKKPEAIIQREIMLAASKSGMTIWRNNVGRAWQGKRIDVSGYTIIKPDGNPYFISRGILLTEYRPVDFGLCPGSADLIGLRPIVLGAKHMGKTVAQFVAIECKSKSARGRASAAQKRFLGHVDSAGGVACVAYSPEDLPS